MTTQIDTTALEASGYQFEQVLSAADSDRSILCLDERGKPVVMKRLDADCLHRGQLHPAIKDRLMRIRELPHPRLAILRGVERFGDSVQMVWNFVNGTAWDQTKQTAEIWIEQARELISAVDFLHLGGIVHGSLHGGNIIVASTGEIWLTDVSPYLYSDPAVDVEAVAMLLKHSITERDDLANAAGALARFVPQRDSLRDLANAIAIESVPALSVNHRDDRIVRRKSLLAAFLLMIGCAVTAFFIHKIF